MRIENGIQMIIGVSIMYNESPLWIMAAITSMAPAVDAFVILDGAFALFPGGLMRPASPIECTHAVIEACNSVNKPFVFYRPTEPFMGNEVEKRNLSLKLAEQISTSPEDWYIIFDMDEVASYISPDFKQMLANSDAMAGDYGLMNWLDAQKIMDQNPDVKNWSIIQEGVTPVRGMYRAIRGLHYEGAHWVLSAPDPTQGKIYIWGQREVHEPMVRSDDFTPYIKLTHRNSQREKTRHDAAKEYYKMRDELGIEKLTQVWGEGLDGKPVAVN